LVGLVGPATNIVLAFVSGLLLQFVTHGFVPSQNPEQWPLVDELLYLFSLTNIFIAVFNLIPIPPLDGSAVLERLLPHSALPSYYRLRSYSIIIVLFFVLLAPGALDALFVHANNYWDNFLNLHVLVSVPVGSNGVALGL
jgi:Zn-dependent protease